MLLQHIDDSESHLFVGDIRDGFLIVLLTREMFERGGHINPLWGQAVTDQRTFEALGRWLSIRRDQWPAWGRLAEVVGSEAFSRHMSKLLTETPIAEVLGTVVKKQEDPVEVVFGEMLFSRKGTAFEEVYRHRFATAAARDRFHDWLFEGHNFHQTENLLQIGYYKGTAALGQALDQLAEVSTTTDPIRPQIRSPKSRTALGRRQAACA